MPLNLTMLDFNDNVIQRFDNQWTSQKGTSELKANYANGVKRLILSKPEGIPEEKLNNFKVCLSESKWIITMTLAFVVIVILTGHMAITIYQMRKIGITKVCKTTGHWMKTTSKYFGKRNC